MCELRNILTLHQTNFLALIEFRNIIFLPPPCCISGPSFNPTCRVEWGHTVSLVSMLVKNSNRG